MSLSTLAVQVISRGVVGRAEETSTYSWSRFCTVNCRPMASNYQLSYLRLCRELNPRLRGGRRECYHSSTMAPITLKDDHVTTLYTLWTTHLVSITKIPLQILLFICAFSYGEAVRCRNLK